MEAWPAGAGPNGKAMFTSRSDGNLARAHNFHQMPDNTDQQPTNKTVKLSIYSAITKFD